MPDALVQHQARFNFVPILRTIQKSKPSKNSNIQSDDTIVALKACERNAGSNDAGAHWSCACDMGGAGARGAGGQIGFVA